MSRNPPPCDSGIKAAVQRLKQHGATLLTHLKGQRRRARAVQHVRDARLQRGDLQAVIILQGARRWERGVMTAGVQSSTSCESRSSCVVDLHL